MSNISLLLTDSDVSSSEGLGSSSIPAKKFKAGNLSNFVVRMVTDQKDALDRQVGRFFFSNNIPFKSVESSEFSKLCSDLRPGHTPPHRKKLAGDLLDQVYEDISAEMKSEIKNKETLVICQDRWLQPVHGNSWREDVQISTKHWEDH
jgi:hypothetical protein